MRLVCPNCEAKYEVPDEAIPDTGRDVQCANCGHAWFQMRARPTPAAPVAQPAAEPEAVPDTEAAGTAEPDEEAQAAQTVPEADPAFDPAEPDDEPDPIPAPEAEPMAMGSADTAPEDARAEDARPKDSDAEDADPEDTGPEPEAILAAERASAAYAVDDSVLAILREEAEREATARRAEARGLETQTDLGLDALPAAPPAVRDVADAFAEVEVKPAPRRDLLPDVEEINSTLRPSGAEGEDGTDAYGVPQSAQRRPGFRGGFLTVMALAILAAGVYVAAPQIKALVPSLDGTLTAYVDQVDGLRLALDGMMRSATVAINGN